jgi:hypothetical protein
MVEDKNRALAEALLLERDELYRERVRLKSRMKEYAHTDVLIASFEQTIKEKDTQLEEKDRRLKEKDRQLKEKESLLSSMREQVEYLRRKLWGKSSERFIAPDPLQRKIDFEGLDLLPQEAALTEKAAEEIKEYRSVEVKVKEKKKPVRQPLGENLPRVEEHIYPQQIDINSGAWVELPSIVTELLEHEPARCYVRRIVRHQYALLCCNPNFSSIIFHSIFN